MTPEATYRYSVLTLNHFYVLLLFAPAIYLLLRRTRANPSAALLLAASAPGAVGWLVLLVMISAANPSLTARSILVMLLYYPASWLLPLISSLQILRLFSSPQPFGKFTYIGVVFTAGLYVLTSATGLARN